MGDTVTLRDASVDTGVPVEVLFGAIVRGQLAATRGEGAAWLVDLDDARTYAAALDASRPARDD